MSVILGPAEKYLRLLADAQVAFHEIDCDGLITYVSQAELSLLGYSQEDMIGKPVWQFVRPEERYTAEQAVRRKLSGREGPSQALERTYHKRDKSRVPVLIDDILVRDSQGAIAGILSTIRDVRPDPVLSRALKDVSYYPSIADNLPVYVLRKDMTGRFTFANSRFCQRRGCQLDDVLNKTDYDLYDKALADKFVADDERVKETGETYETIEKHDPDGTGVRKVDVQVIKAPLFDPNQKMRGIQIVYWELHDRESILAEYLTSYRHIIEQLPLWIYRKDAQGRFTFVTDRYCEHVGRRRDEIIGKTDFDFFPEQLAEKYTQDDRRVLDDGEIVEDEEWHQPTGGDRIFVHVKKVPLRDAERRIIGLQGVFWDITQEKQLRVEQERNSLWQEVALVGAHKMGNPIFAIETWLDPLLKRIEGGHREEAASMVTNIRASVEKVKSIVQQLKSMSQTTYNIQRDVRLLPLLSQSCQTAENQGVQCSVNCPNDLVLSIDADRIAECIDELVGNSIRWMNREVKQIRIRVTEVVPQIPEFVDVKGSQTCIEFTDTGPGISNEDKVRLFHAFYTTHPQGTGMGMAIVRHIIETHGGRIVESGDPGKGCCFLILLPVQLKDPATDI